MTGKESDFSDFVENVIQVADNFVILHSYNRQKDN